MSTWVKATDNRHYRDPLIMGHGYTITFPNDAPPEVVLVAGDMSPEQAQVRAELALLQHGIVAALVSEPRTEWRTEAGQWIMVYALELELLEPIPCGAMPAFAYAEVKNTDLLIV